MYLRGDKMSKCADGKCTGGCSEEECDSDEANPSSEASINTVLVKRLADPKRKKDTCYII
jgi:hypothetical protein